MAESERAKSQTIIYKKTQQQISFRTPDKGNDTLLCPLVSKSHWLWSNTAVQWVKGLNWGNVLNFIKPTLTLSEYNIEHEVIMFNNTQTGSY